MYSGRVSLVATSSPAVPIAPLYSSNSFVAASNAFTPPLYSSTSGVTTGSELTPPE